MAEKMNNIRSLVRALLYHQSDIQKLIDAAHKFPRYRKHSFTFRGMRLDVTDFLSVAHQLLEYFSDERMIFKAGTSAPVIYDCGSNVGISVLYFKKIFPSSRIMAFEPDPEIYHCLQKNLQQNGISDVHTFNKAVWSSNDAIEFGSEGADAGSVFHPSGKMKVPAVRLRTLLESETLVDCLKMDIEGAEYEVLHDSANQLHKIGYFFVEYHSWKNKEQQLGDLLNILSENQFRYYISAAAPALKQPFIDTGSNPMDIQLDIHAVNTKYIR